MSKLPYTLYAAEKWLADGGNASLKSDSQGLKRNLLREALGLFPPDLVIEVKAIACE